MGYWNIVRPSHWCIPKNTIEQPWSPTVSGLWISHKFLYNVTLITASSWLCDYYLSASVSNALLSVAVQSCFSVHITLVFFALNNSNQLGVEATWDSLASGYKVSTLPTYTFLDFFSLQVPPPITSNKGKWCGLFCKIVSCAVYIDNVFALLSAFIFSLEEAHQGIHITIINTGPLQDHIKPGKGYLNVIIVILRWFLLTVEEATKRLKDDNTYRVDKQGKDNASCPR